MYEAVSVGNECQTTLTRYATTASRFGFDGVVARQPASEAPAEHSLSAERLHCWEQYSIDVVDAVEFRTTAISTIRRKLDDVRESSTLVVVRGGSPERNRFAVEEPRVDVLSAPMETEGEFNHVLAKAATRNAVHVECDLAPVLRCSGGTRVRALQDLQKLWEILAQYDTPFVVSGSPQSHLELRAPRELQAVGQKAGIDSESILKGLEAWGELAARNRERHSESFIAPGVERTRYEKDD